jgi:membrane protein
MQIFQRIKNFGKLLVSTGKEFIKDAPFNYAAVIAFYTIFSLPGVLIVAVVVAGSIYDQEAVTGGITEQITYMVGSESASEVKKILENARNTESSTVARIVGIATLLFSATTVFISLQDALNRIWSIRPKPKRGIVKFLIDRLLSFAMVVSIGFLLLVSLILDTVLALLGSSINELIGIDIFVAGILNILLSGAIIFLIFALLFKVLPDAVIKWSDVWSGALMTTVLFILGKYLIGFYLGNSSVGSAYGAAGSLVLLLVWIYYSSILFLFGAEFTFVYSRERGKKIQPTKEAVRIRVVEIEED